MRRQSEAGRCDGPVIPHLLKMKVVLVHGHEILGTVLLRLQPNTQPVNVGLAAADPQPTGAEG